ncbi:MAG: aspartate aminotransferase family protein [Myxococcales bacterium]|nr:aspartate aminotransferase family protein [Myxococcales bacterium]
MPGVIHVNDCSIDHCAHGHAPAACAATCPGELDAIMTFEGRGTIAAAIFEPVPGANGVYIPHDTYWPAIAAACAKHGALLIADEVLTGFGRTGLPFAHKRWGVVPDMITVAKALTGGYAPLSAVIVHKRIADHFDDVVLACGLTNYAHPLGCAAGVAALTAYEDEGMYQNAEALAPQLRQALQATAAALAPRAVKARSLGLMGCLEITAELPAWQAFARELAARHVALHVDASRQTAIITPPLCITSAELADGMARFTAAARAAFA